MSFLVGSVAGALVTGGVYYGFSNLIQTRTEEHRVDMHSLSDRLTNASTLIPSPPPASTRITHRPFASLLQSRWNDEMAGLFRSIGTWEERAEDWGRNILYGNNSRARNS
ncbi:hypothetical protein SERLA73DRAFT_134424 [Serpula lacrymans var. lacrymans S7.3]|uniref:MICOS complex subunit MIC12 n=1 Tax=Serpula lacrymans var. lacrymans (strain S7.3) TaxID=936435 RepID=F8PRT2_SERL3|nr:hypothetical protein SERLA73DRAFT_134424 [Serpula lacrymans var. lacrymans S7.3]